MIQKRGALQAVLALLTFAAGCGDEQPPVRLVAEGVLPVEGAGLWYLTQGSGAPLVLLHGGPGLGQGYLLSELEMPGFPPPGLRWIAYDQRGSGRSTGADDPAYLTMDRFVEDLEAVRVASGEDRVALLGHSFGGLLAMSYAVRYPEHVAAMILIDPDPASRELWAAHEQILAPRVTDEDRLLIESITAGEDWEIDSAQLENYHLVRFRSYFGNRAVADRLRLGLTLGVYGNFPGTALAVRASLGDWDIFEALGAVEARTLIVTGDQSVFPAEAHERLAATLPNAELVVLPGVGHFPHMEDQAGFAAAVNAFLASITQDVPAGDS